MYGHRLGAEFRKQAPRRLASSFWRDRWWRDYQGRSLRYGLWLRGQYGLRETVSTSNTHSPIQARSSSKQLTWWGEYQKLVKDLVQGQKAWCFLRLLKTIDETQCVLFNLYLFYCFLVGFRRSCWPRCMACMAFCLTTPRPSCFLYTVFSFLY